ncbi:MAG: hypothetical protein J5I92_09445 [Thiogranum sp.]|nr:hypothetical protein [Thiogranum sp.]
MVRRFLIRLLIASLGVSASALALQDPTRPTNASDWFGNKTSGTQAEWSLQSILTGPDRRIAVINGTRVREGDRIGTARVVQIEDSRVLLRTGEGTLTLRLLPTTSRIKP